MSAPARAQRKSGVLQSIGLRTGARRSPVSRIAFYLLVLIIVVYTVFPFYWALRSALTPDADLFATPIQYFPAHPTLDHFTTVLGSGQFQRALWNSFFVSTCVTIIALAVGSSAAYALGRFQFRGRTVVQYIILSMTLFPTIAILGSLYTVVSNLHMYDHLSALIFTYMIFTLPFTVWVLTSFFRQMPRELEEAAYIDGASPFQTFYKVMLPLVLPGLVTTGLLAFIAAWNEFLFALSFEQSPSNYLVNVAITNFPAKTGSSFQIPWGDIMAATVIVTVPLIILTLILQRKILAGLTAGAVKG